MLRSRGYELVEQYRRMRIAMDGQPSEPALPDGIRIRTAVRGEDERSVYEVIEDANSDDPRHEPMDYTSWLRCMVDTYRYDPSLWWLALAGDEIVGRRSGWSSRTRAG